MRESEREGKQTRRPRGDFVRKRGGNAEVQNMRVEKARKRESA